MERFDTERERSATEPIRSATRAPTHDAPPIEARIARPATVCYELFCDVESMPEWMPILRSVSVRSRYRNGRPCDVSFLASLHRATVGYTLTYTYRERDLHVAWCPEADTGINVGGWAHFRAVNVDSCLLVCDLWLNPAGVVNRWRDPLFDAHAPFAVASRFRGFATRAARAPSNEVTLKRAMP